MRTNTGQILYIPRIGQRADFQHPLMRGCVGWWPLNDGAGTTTKDISGNSETLTNGGSSVWATREVGVVAVVNGNTGKYYSTDSSFSTMIGGSTPATDPWSISLWASLYLTAPYEYEAGFLSIGSSSADGTPFLIAQRSGTFVRVHWGGSYTNTTSVSNQAWTNIVITFDGTTMNYYTNGSIAGSRTSPGTNVSLSDKLWIGTGYNNVGTRTDDHIQNVRVYNRALSPTEILELYTNPWSGLSMPSETRYFFVPQLITASPKLFNIKGSSISMTSNTGRVSVRAAR